MEKKRAALLQETNTEPKVQIKSRDVTSSVEFYHIKGGSPFYYGLVLCMKLSDSSGHHNAVSLAAGKLLSFDADFPVIPKEAKVIVEEEA